MRISVNIISIVIVLLFFGCSQEVQKRVKINPEFAQYISAYTSGIVSRESSIKIMLSDEAAKAIVSEGQTIGDIIRFNPAIEGKAVFVSDRMIEFTPKNLLKSGTEYTAYFDLGKMTKMPQGLEEFNFQFKTIEQDLNKLGLVSGFNEYPVTFAPDSANQIESQPPLNPVWPVIKTFFPFQKFLSILIFLC